MTIMTQEHDKAADDRTEDRMEDRAAGRPGGDASETKASDARAEPSSEGAAAAGSGAAESTAETGDDRALTDRVARLEGELATLKNDYLRALADGQNAQARADRRIEQNTKYAVANFAKDLVTVADNLQRALAHVPAEARKADELLNSLATGVEMTEKALTGALERNGLHRIESLNQPFDPNRHKAVQEVENTAVPAGTVVQVFQEGYVLHDRLVREAMVVVSRGGPKRVIAPQEPTPESAPGEWGPHQDPAGRHVDTSA